MQLNIILLGLVRWVGLFLDGRFYSVVKRVLNSCVVFWLFLLITMRRVKAASATMTRMMVPRTVTSPFSWCSSRHYLCCSLDWSTKLLLWLTGSFHVTG